ncbi:MAG: hypothetical protein JRJ82_13510, partial [Deltaproteobacteria bacterium]|nr:hypothetical protein [Deltaproteobacteria bacterium]
MHNKKIKKHLFPGIRVRSGLGPVALFLLITALGFILPGTALAAYVRIPFDQVNTWTWHDRDFMGGSGFNTYWQWDAGLGMNRSMLRMDAGGIDVWDPRDRRDFRYLNNYPGDWDAIVEVTSQENTNGWAKAGIMVKNRAISGEDNSSYHGYCMVAVTPGNGVTFQWDADLDGRLDQTVQTGPGSVSAPVWLRLKKVG